MPNNPAISRISASKGGKAVAKKGKRFCEDRAQKGGQALVMTYGREYMRALIMRRYATVK